MSTFTTSFRTNYNGLFSAMVIIILPPVILYCVFSKFFVEALSGGAVKKEEKHESNNGSFDRAGLRGGWVYAAYAQSHPEDHKIVAE